MRGSFAEPILHPLQIPIRPLSLLEAPALNGRHAGLVARIPLRLAHPFAPCLSRAHEYWRARLQSCPLREVGLPMPLNYPETRSRTSGENRLVRPIDPILPKNKASEESNAAQETNAQICTGRLRSHS